MDKEKMTPISGNDFVQCSLASGGTLRECTPDGEWVSDIYVPPGRYRASRFMVNIGRRAILVPGNDVIVYSEQRHYLNDFGELGHETAASQNFQVDRREREERRSRRIERKLDAIQRRQMLQERALERSRGADPDDASARDAEAEAAAAEAERLSAEADTAAAKKKKADEEAD